MDSLNSLVVPPLRESRHPFQENRMAEGYVKVCTLRQLRGRRCIPVKLGDHSIAIFYHDGKVNAVHNRCPHSGYPLETGSVKDGIVTCLWHQARFDLSDGTCVTLGIRRYRYLRRGNHRGRGLGLPGTQLRLTVLPPTPPTTEKGMSPHSSPRFFWCLGWVRALVVVRRHRLSFLGC